MSDSPFSGLFGKEALRPLTPRERDLLAALLRPSFPGRRDLIEQISGLQVISIDDDGSLKLVPREGAAASVTRRIPVEAEVEDEDGVMIHVLFHVLDGRLNELEIFRDDSAGVLHPIDPDTLRHIVL
ncbi:MAG: hypothetical protein WDM88_04600 [Galbitalea sp.]